MNDAFKAWSSDMPNEPPPADLKRTWEGIHALLNSPPAANAPISTKQTEPPAEIVSGSAICDPASFRDPEHNVRTIADCEEACSSKPPQKGRLLPKRGMNRRLTGMPAGGDDHTETITSQAHRFSADLSTGTCKSTRHIPSNTISKVEATLQVTLSQLTPPPQQNTQVQSTLPQLTPLPQQRTPAQVTARPSRMESRVSIYDQRRQPETGAILPGMEVDSRIPFTTPIDVKVIDLVLDGRATVENQVIWLTRQIECVQGMWTLPNQALVRVLQTRQVVSQEQCLPQGEKIHAFPPAQCTLPCICDAPCNAPQVVPAEDNQAEDSDKNAGVSGEGRHDEREVAQVATVQTAMTPSTGPAGQRTPRTPRRSQLAHTTTRSTAPATAGLVQEGARQDADREPLLTDALTEAADQQAGMLGQGTTKVRPDPALRLRTEKETSAPASAPSDDALSSSPRRRRRGGRRRRKPSPLPPTTAGGGGGA